MVTLIFLMPDGVTQRKIDAEIGSSLLEVARAQGLDEIEGACEGAMACSTCHVIFEDADYDKLAEPSEAEEDMLDIANGARPTSRLGCQVIVSEALDGARIKLPKSTRNMLF